MILSAELTEMSQIQILVTSLDINKDVDQEKANKVREVIKEGEITDEM